VENEPSAGEYARSFWRDDLSRPARSPRRLTKYAVTCGASASPARDEEIRAADQDGAALRRGSGRDARPRTLSVADTSELRSGFRLIGGGWGAFGFLPASSVGGIGQTNDPRAGEMDGPVPVSQSWRTIDSVVAEEAAWAFPCCLPRLRIHAK
jgi:hypothetical protein